MGSFGVLTPTPVPWCKVASQFVEWWREYALFFPDRLAPKTRPPPSQKPIPLGADVPSFPRAWGGDSVRQQSSSPHPQPQLTGRQGQPERGQRGVGAGSPSGPAPSPHHLKGMWGSR